MESYLFIGILGNFVRLAATQILPEPLIPFDRNNSVCLGPAATHGQFRPSCPNNNSVIAINNLKVAAKPISFGCPATVTIVNGQVVDSLNFTKVLNETACCLPDESVDCSSEFDYTDSGLDFLYHKKTSGYWESSPDLDVSWARTDCQDKTYPRVTHFMYTEYSCIELERIGDICSSNTYTVTDETFYLQNTGYPSSISSTIDFCQCQISTTGQNIKFYSVDVRLQKYGSECKQMLNISDSDGFITAWDCASNPIFNITEVTKYKAVTVTLVNDLLKDGGNIWIGFSGESEETLTIKCRYQQKDITPVSSSIFTTSSIATTALSNTTSTTDSTTTAATSDNDSTTGSVTTTSITDSTSTTGSVTTTAAMSDIVSTTDSVTTTTMSDTISTTDSITTTYISDTTSTTDSVTTTALNDTTSTTGPVTTADMSDTTSPTDSITTTTMSDTTSPTDSTTTTAMSDTTSTSDSVTTAAFNDTIAPTYLTIITDMGAFTSSARDQPANQQTIIVKDSNLTVMYVFIGVITFLFLTFAVCYGIRKECGKRRGTVNSSESNRVNSPESNRETTVVQNPHFENFNIVNEQNGQITPNRNNGTNNDTRSTAESLGSSLRSDSTYESVRMVPFNKMHDLSDRSELNNAGYMQDLPTEHKNKSEMLESEKQYFDETKSKRLSQIRKKSPSKKKAMKGKKSEKRSAKGGKKKSKKVQNVLNIF